MSDFISSTHDCRLVTWQIHFLKAHYSLPLWARLECETQLASKWLDEQSPSCDHGSCRKLVPERRVTEGDMTLTGFIINFSYWPIQFLSSRKNFCLGRLVRWRHWWSKWMTDSVSCSQSVSSTTRNFTINSWSITGQTHEKLTSICQIYLSWCFLWNAVCCHRGLRSNLLIWFGFKGEVTPKTYILAADWRFSL